MKSDSGLGYRANEGLRGHTREEVCRRTVMIRLCTQVLMIGFLASAAHAQSPKHLWVLQEPNEIVQYDAASFAARRTIKVPHRLFEGPADDM